MSWWKILNANKGISVLPLEENTPVRPLQKEMMLSNNSFGQQHLKTKLHSQQRRVNSHRCTMTSASVTFCFCPHKFSFTSFLEFMKCLVKKCDLFHCSSATNVNIKHATIRSVIEKEKSAHSLMEKILRVCCVFDTPPAQHYFCV